MPPDGDGRPPILRTWGGVYAIVLGTLIALIALFSYWSAVYK
ncbi:MAG TPA: hypothetical protein VII38_11300 [Polyangia bacterium]|jgi:hypothetical protein